MELLNQITTQLPDPHEKICCQISKHSHSVIQQYQLEMLTLDCHQLLVVPYQERLHRHVMSDELWNKDFTRRRP